MHPDGQGVALVVRRAWHWYNVLASPAMSELPQYAPSPATARVQGSTIMTVTQRAIPIGPSQPIVHASMRSVRRLRQTYTSFTLFAAPIDPPQ